MGYYNIYRIIKDIIRTIFGKNFLKILFVVLTVICCVFLFTHDSFAYSLDNNQSSIYTYEASLQEYFINALADLYYNYKNPPEGSSPNDFIPSGFEKDVENLLSSLYVGSGWVHPGDYNRTDASTYTIFVDWAENPSAGKFNAQSFTNSPTSADNFKDRCNYLMLYAFNGHVVNTDPSQTYYWHNINCGLAGHVGNNDKLSGGHMFYMYLDLTTGKLGSYGGGYAWNVSEGGIKTGNAINIPCNLLYYRSPVLQDIVAPLFADSPIDYSSSIADASSNIQSSIEGMTSSVTSSLDNGFSSLNDNITNSTTQITDSLSENTDAVKEQTEFLTDDSVSDDSMNIDTSQFDLNDGGSSDFIITVLNQVQSTFNGISSGQVYEVSIPLPHGSAPLVLSSDAISKNIKGTWIETAINTFWTFFFGVFLVLFAKRFTDFFSRGDFANGGLSSLIKRLDNENVVIKSTMM